MGKLKEYEQQQTTWKSSLASQVAHETGKVVGGLTELHRMVDNSLNMFNERLKALEQDGKDGGKSHGKSLLAAKDMKPGTLDKEENWRKWKSDIEDYCEEMFPGLKEMMDHTKNADSEVDELLFKEDHW